MSDLQVFLEQNTRTAETMTVLQAAQRFHRLRGPSRFTIHGATTGRWSFTPTTRTTKGSAQTATLPRRWRSSPRAATP